VAERWVDNPAPAPTPVPPNGPEADAVIAEILELLAEAIVADIKEDNADFGCVPSGKEP